MRIVNVSEVSHLLTKSNYTNEHSKHEIITSTTQKNANQ